MAIGRRGAVFTLMAIVVAVLIMATERTVNPSLSPLQAETAAARTRVSLMNAYTVTLEQNTEQSLRTAGYFLLRNMSARIRADKVFYPGTINATVAQCIVNGTMNVSGTSVDCLPAQFEVQYALDRVAELAEDELAIATTYAITDAWVTEEHPLEVVFWLRISYNVSDTFAAWEFQDVIIRADVDATGAEDPVHAYLAGAGLLSSTRNLSLTEFRRGEFNASVFSQFYGNGSYLFLDNRSPSVLQRYAGDIMNRSACCGVESVIDVSSLTGTPQAYVNYSMSDHQFLAHILGTLPKYDCVNLEVKGIQQGARKLVLDAWRFDTVYNLTGALPACAYP